MENVIIKDNIFNTTIKKSKVKNRLGEINLNNQGEEMAIIEYNNSQDITIQFKSTKEIISKTTYYKFKNGDIKFRFSPSVYGVGITGLLPSRDINGELLDCYSCWRSMIKRCYNSKSQKKYQPYGACIVSEEFKFYENFKKFYDENYYEIEKLGRTDLDKDILHKNNKIYSKDTCVFVPQAINKLFTKRQNYRGDLPIGVTPNGKNYQARCSNGSGKEKCLGTYPTPELAFNVYKEFKENYIKQTAEIYKNQIPQNLYKAMMNYIVEITD